MYSKTDDAPVEISNDQWKEILMRGVYHIAREWAKMNGQWAISNNTNTWKNENAEVDTSYCAACGNSLFKSNDKFNSNCGWPGFLSQSIRIV